MRRSLAGSFFVVATVLFATAVGGFWFQRTALSSAAAGEEAAAVLADDELAATYRGLLAETAAPLVYPGDPDGRTRVLATIDQVFDIDAGRRLASPTFEAIHARVVGDVTGPIVVTPAEIVEIVRDEHAAVAPAIAFTVGEVGVYALIDTVLRVLVPATAVAALVLWGLLLLGRPERGSFLRGAGVVLIATALSTLAGRWVAPVALASFAGGDVWSGIPGAAAAARRGSTVAVVLLLSAAGAALVVTGTRMRPSRRWSAPISVHREGFERRWS